MADMLSTPESFIDFVLNKGNGVTGLSQLNLKKVPHQYIIPPQERLDHIPVSVQESIPIIDVSNWEDPKIAESICNAAAKWGFFQIINHGIPLEVLENVKRASHDFFELPVEERSKYLKGNSPSYTVILGTSFSPLAEKVLDWKDHLSHISDGQENEHSKHWPSLTRDVVLDYKNRTKPIIRKLLEVLLTGVGVKELNEARESALMGLLVINLLHYPSCPNPDLVVGNGPHSDVSCLTLLLQDDVGALYVRSTETECWIHVGPTKGALIVNIGNVLQIVSNDKYKSIEHRVYVSGNKNRVSVPVFASPLRDASSSIGPLKEVLEGGEKPKYRNIVYLDYFNYFSSKGHDGKQTMDYVRI